MGRGRVLTRRLWTKAGTFCIVAVLSLGCDIYPRACTLIGCNDGLTIEVTGAITGPTTIEVAAAGQTTRTFACNPGQPCEGFLENFTPTQATVTVRLPDRTVERSVTPQYQESRPNGEDCPPVCRQATVQVAI